MRRAVELDPRSAYRHRNLALYALTYLRSDPGAVQLAAESFQRAVALEPALAPEAADRLVVLDAKLLAVAIPKEPALLLSVGRHLVLKGHVAAALPLLEDALALAPGVPERVAAHLAMSQAHLRSRDAASALRHAREALVLEPRSAAVYAALAEAYEAAGQWTDAQTALSTAVGLADGAPGSDAGAYRERLAAFLARHGDRGQALVVRQETVRSRPGEAWPHVELARLHEQRGTWVEAFREYRLAESLGVGDARVLTEVAQAYLRNGLVREAAVAYDAAVRREPADLEIRLTLAQLYTRLGRRDKALEQYREVAARQPGLEAARPPAPVAVVPLGGVGR
jgi:tetratricopeptide (TPR) repeat protein